MSQRVTVQCDCGASGDVPVGMLVECECGRSFVAAGPPAEHATQVDSLMRRHRVALAASLLMVLAVCASPLLVLDHSAALLVPVAAVTVWFATIRPHLERRHRRALAALPEWALPGA